VSVDFRHGNAESLPFQTGSYDLIVCQAAFKNFARPVAALDEMHRVLRPGGVAVIQDLRRDATGADLDEEVRRMEVGRLSAAMTKLTLAALRLRAAPPAHFRRLARESAFGTCAILEEGVNLEVRLTKPAAA
jgi:ubiquinone/menaquinone biosynthesis C-methylase UbiE